LHDEVFIFWIMYLTSGLYSIYSL